MSNNHNGDIKLCTSSGYNRQIRRAARSAPRLPALLKVGARLGIGLYGPTTRQGTLVLPFWNTQISCPSESPRSSTGGCGCPTGAICPRWPPIYRLLLCPRPPGHGFVGTPARIHHPSYSQSTDHLTSHPRLRTSPLYGCGSFSQILRCRRPTGDGDIGFLVRRFPRDAESARLGRFVVVCVVVSVGLRACTQCAERLHFFFSSLAASFSTSPQAVTSSSSRTRTQRGATSRGGRLLPRSGPWQ